MAPRVPVDLSDRTVRSAFTAPVNTAQVIKSSHLFSGWVVSAPDHRARIAGLAGEAFLDCRVLLLPDAGHEVRRHERVGWPVELQLDECLALGEQHERHTL